MKNTIKKISAFLLSLVMLFGIVPLADLDIIASAATYSGTCGDNLTWTLDTETGELVISGSGKMYDWDYLSKQAPWYDNRSYISTVTIGSGVTNIGDSAYYNCTSLANIEIPDSVTSIGNSAFKYCKSLTSITVDENNTVYSSDEYGLLFNKDKTQLIRYPSGNESTTYVIPDSVTKIDGSAFEYCTSLTSIEIPDSVKSIGSSAFYHTGYYNDSTNWTNGILYIGKYLVDAKDTLNGAYTVKEGTKVIADNTFFNCEGLTSIEIPDSVTSIGDCAFCCCDGLTSIEIPDSVTSIGDEVFSQCDGLKSVDIPNSIVSIGNDAFSHCGSLKNIKIPDSVKSIGDHAFRCCDSLTSVTFGNSITNIGEAAFQDCDSLTSIEIPDSVTSIDRYLFSNCDNLSSITIGSGVTSIGISAFTNTGYYNNSINWENCVLYIEDYLIEAKDTISGTYTVKEGTKTIAGQAFYNCKMLTNIDIPDSVISIGERAFVDCDNFTSVTIGNGVTSIGISAFSSCTSLTSIDIPDSVTSIGNSAFINCYNLATVTIGNGVTSIGNGAFRYCGSIPDVYYNGTKKQWNEITIGTYNEDLLNANIHFLGHECDYTAVVTPPTCQSQGYTTYTCEECGDSYVDDYTDTVDHYYLDGKCIWCGDTNVTPSSIIDITYTPSDSARKLFTVTCADRAQMIQFIEPDGGTRTYYRNNANVKITSYNADGEVVGELSRDLAYEVWEIYSNMSIGTTIKVRAKFNSRWELDKRSLVVYEYNPVISMELSRTSGKKGPVPATVVADEKTEKVMFKMPNNTSVTVSTYTTDENGNRVFKGNAWMNEDGLNEINVLIRRKNVWKTVGTLEYTVE